MSIDRVNTPPSNASIPGVSLASRAVPSSIPSEHPVTKGLKNVGKGLLLGLAGLGAVLANALGVALVTGFVAAIFCPPSFLIFGNFAKSFSELLSRLFVGSWEGVAALKDELFP